MAQRQLWICGIAIALLLTAGAVVKPAVSKQVKPAAVFVIGDSYSDTGNRNKTNPLEYRPWKLPYGITWKSGRFSDGRVSTDYLVDLFGLPPLKTYASISNTTPPEKVIQGVNFAVGGAGAFPLAGGSPTFSQQVDRLKVVVDRYSNVFDPHRSVVVFSCSGNDYFQYFSDHPNATLPDTLAFARTVVAEIGRNVKNLYALGFRNFAMLSLTPIECIPQVTGQNATSCNPQPGNVDTYHNAQLLALLHSFQTNLTGSSFVALDLVTAFNYVIDNPTLFGIKHPLGACCAPLPTHPANTCGDFDAQGNPLFSLCEDRQDHFWWDLLHPTNAGWKAAINLFYSGVNFTAMSPNLLFWLNSLDLASSNQHPPESYSNATLAAVQTLAPLYPRLVQFLGGNGALPYLTTALSKVGPVTLFVPSEEAIEQQIGPVADAWQKRPGLTAQLALQQLVYGWWPADRLAQLSNGHQLRTLGGSKVHVLKADGSIYIVTAAGRAAIVKPQVFAAKGKLLVHTTSTLLSRPSAAFSWKINSP